MNPKSRSLIPSAVGNEPIADIQALSAALAKKRVSIDQCFLANICEQDPKSLELHKALRSAHAAGKIICPIHLEESVFESSMLPPALRDQIFALQNSLADGWSFHSFGQKLAYDTITPVLEWLYPPFRPVDLQIKPGTDFDALGKINRLGKKDYITRLSQLSYPPPSYVPGMNAEKIAEFITAERCGSMYRILKAIKEKGTIATGKSEWEYTSAVGEFLLGLRITPRDCDTLIARVIDRQWDAMPIFWAHTRLNAQIEHGYLVSNRKAKANDQLDLTRIAVGLNDADVILCDHPMAEVIKQSGVLEILDRAHVFSTKQLDAAIDCIKKL